MIVLFTDFGLYGPYTGLLKAVLMQHAPGIPIVDLFSDAPTWSPRPAAYLLAAYNTDLPLDSVFLCVVDPGVGGSARRPVVLRADGRWYVGPDNGLFNVVAGRARSARWWEITWRPPRISRTFHGRDLFAPVAAFLARGEQPPGEPIEVPPRAEADWPADLSEVIYIDHYGNAMTGTRASSVANCRTLTVGRHRLLRATKFSDVAPGQPFWYENANGLVEIALNQGRADEALGIKVGDTVVLK